MLSVIIPTFERKEILTDCLSHLTANKTSFNFEVLVIEDGSKNSQAVVNYFSKDLNIKYFSQEKKGQGAARNLGIEKSRGDILVFIGDDILVGRNFLEEHHYFHAQNSKNNFVCIGLTNFHSKLQNRFSSWLENDGFQFDFRKLSKGKKPNFKHFYTSNISLKKELLEKQRFDESFSGYGFEDIELGFRLEKEEKMILKFNPQAKALHFHEIKEKDFYQRMKSVGRAARIFEEKHPGIGIVPSGFKLRIQKIISRSPQLLGLFKKEWKFYATGKKAFLKGLLKP